MPDGEVNLQPLDLDLVRDGAGRVTDPDLVQLEGGASGGQAPYVVVDLPARGVCGSLRLTTMSSGARTRSAKVIGDRSA